jgi:hypothetical protein
MFATRYAPVPKHQCAITGYCESHARTEARRIGIELPVDVAELLRGYPVTAERLLQILRTA